MHAASACALSIGFVSCEGQPRYTRSTKNGVPMFRGLLTWLVFLVMTPCCSIPGAIAKSFRGGSNSTMRFGRAWGRSMLWATGTCLRTHGLDRLTAREPCIYVVNHQSYLDVWAVLDVVPLTTRFVAKASLFRIPAMGWAMRAAGFIPIDRGNRHQAIRSLDLAVERIRAGRNVLLFPEGTRSRNGQLQSFKKGPFHLAMRANVPIVPIVISGTHRILRPGDWRVRPGEATLRVLDPVDVEEFLPNNHNGLRDKVREQFVATLGADAHGVS
jgi:1-acyl-sn-glycerol-3-phosphate acyltransferase